MTSRRHPSRLIGWLLLGLGSAAFAQPGRSAEQVFTCVNAAGKSITSDRLIAECMDREQRVLARDGTLIRVIPPSLTPEERAEKERLDRERLAKEEARKEAARSDRNLVSRFPNAAAHQKAREQALETVQYAIAQSEARIGDLQRERKPLMDEAEFYVGKQLPSKLKAQLDANDAAATAQKELLANQKVELERVSKKYDTELAHLKRLWNGAAPGSLPQPAEAAATPSKAAAPKTGVRTVANTRGN